MKNSRKLKKLEKQMALASTYEEWREAAIQHDELSGQKRWREVDQTSLYDYTQIRLRLDRLRRALAPDCCLHSTRVSTAIWGVWGAAASIAAPSSAPSN